MILFNSIKFIIFINNVYIINEKLKQFFAMKKTIEFAETTLHNIFKHRQKKYEFNKYNIFVK